MGTEQGKFNLLSADGLAVELPKEEAESMDMGTVLLLVLPDVEEEEDEEEADNEVDSPLTLNCWD